MAYYVGTQEFASLYDAIPYAQLVNGTVTSEPVSTSGMLTDPVLDTSFETPPEDIPGPSIPGDGGEIDNGLEINGRITPDLEMLIAIMVGTQGTIEGLDPETIEALQTAIEGSSAEELERIAQEIEEAGGFEEWLAQQPTGDPGDLEPPPAPEPEPEEEPEVVQVPISEADFNEQFPNVDPSEYTESGTWTDPETGIVYVINIPPPVEEEPTEEEPGGGGAEAPTEEEGEPTEDQPEEEEVIVDPTDSTVDDEDAETAETVPPDTTETEEEEATPPPFFRVENGQVYVIDYGTGEYISVEEYNKKYDWLPERWYEDYLGSDPADGAYTDNGVLIEDEDIIFDLPPLPEQEDTGIIIPEEEPDIVFDPSQTPDFPGGPAPIPEQEPEEPTEPTEPTEPVPPVEEVPETPEEPTPPAEEPEQPTEETEPTPTTEQPTEQPTPTEEAPETPEEPGTETPSDTPTTGTDETGTAGEGEGDGTGTGTGTGEGEGEGDGTGDGEKRDGLFDDYKEFMTSIGYQPVQLQQIIAPPNIDYSAGLPKPPQMKDYNQALNGVIANSLQKRKTGMLV